MLFTLRGIQSACGLHLDSGCRPASHGLARGRTKEVARLDLDGGSKSFQRRDFWVAHPALDPTHLTCLDATSLRDLFLRETEPFAGGAQVYAEIAHGEDRPA
jgi:hypothetical protein